MGGFYFCWHSHVKGVFLRHFLMILLTSLLMLFNWELWLGYISDLTNMCILIRLFSQNVLFFFHSIHSFFILAHFLNLVFVFHFIEWPNKTKNLSWNRDPCIYFLVQMSTVFFCHLCAGVLYFNIMILWWDTPYRIELFQSNRSIGANISKFNSFN